MSRNFGFPNVTRPIASGGQPLPASHYAPDTRRNLNSLARHLPPGLAERNLAIVVSDRPFLSKRELNPVERLNAELDHREFAVCVCVSIFITIVFGLPIAAATAIMSWG